MILDAQDIPALRRFGWQMTLAWPAIFGLLLPWLFDAVWPLWPWCLAAVFLVLTVLAPRLLYWPGRLWLAFAHVMGWLNTRLILALLFFVVLTQLGWLLRALDKLDYRAGRRIDTSTSYWQASEHISADNMKDPF